MSHRGGPRLRLRWAVEAALVVMIVVASGAVADRFLTTTRPKSFAEWELLPAAMMACGHGFTLPSVEGAAARAFLLRQTEALSCEILTAGAQPVPAPRIALSHRYSIALAGFSFQVLGLDWASLDTYMSVLFGIAMALAYGLFRQGVGPFLATLGVAALVCSNLLLGLLSLRDFVKLPCFMAAWLVLAWLLRRGWHAPSPALYLPAAVGGLVVGLGLGFRVDVLIVAPAFVAVITLALPGFRWSDWAVKGRALAGFGLGLGLAGGPIIASMSAGSNSAHVVVLGLMGSYNRVLGVDAAPYDIGDTSSDGYAYAVIAAHGGLVQGEAPPIDFGSARYDQIGARLLRDVAANFPADVLTRSLGATAQIIRYPFNEAARTDYQEIAPLYTSASLLALSGWRERAMGVVEEDELLLAGLVVAAVALRDWRAGVVAAAMVLYFCGYTQLQFYRRHTFHLDIIPIGLVLLSLHLPATALWHAAQRAWHGATPGRADARRAARRVAIGAVATAGVAAVVTGALWGARAWQQRHVTSLIERTLAVAWETVPVQREALSSTTLRNGVPTNTWYEVYQSDWQRWASAVLLRVEPPPLESASHDDWVHAEYFRLTLAAGCGNEDVLVAIKYSGVEETFHKEFTRVVVVPVAPGEASQLLMPALYQYGPSWSRFDGFALAANQADCVVAVTRAADPAEVPLPIMAVVLAPGWRERPLYQRLQSRPRMTVAGTPVAPMRSSALPVPPSPALAFPSPLPALQPPAPELPAFPEPPLRSPLGGSQRLLTHALPAPTSWLRGDDVSVSKHGDGYLVEGNGIESAYQLLLPLDVPPGAQVIVRVDGAIEQGRVCLGVLDEQQKGWLLPPDGSRQILSFSTGANARVHLVFANCGGPTPARFRVRTVSYDIIQP